MEAVLSEMNDIGTVVHDPSFVCEPLSTACLGAQHVAGVLAWGHALTLGVDSMGLWSHRACFWLYTPHRW